MNAATNKVRWGVLGAAGIARRRTIPEGIIPATNAELAAVFDPIGGEAVAKEFGVTYCATEDDLLAQDIDAVYIATPVFLHNKQVRAAAKAGKHVLCEKPLGLTVDEAEAALKACNDAGVKLGTALMMRFHACHVEAKKLIDAGNIGTPVLGRAQLSCWYPPMDGAWRQDPARGGGGSLMDMGCHCTDLLEMLFGRIVSVTCQTANLVHDYKSEDTATVLLRFENGAMGMVDTLFNVPDTSVLSRLEIYGSKGSIMSEGTIGQGEAGSLQLRLSDAGGYDAQQQRSGDGGPQTIEPTPANPYRGEIEHFSQAILDDTQPTIGGELGVWTQRVMAACYESARTGKTITL
jgi:predicted dehydrogenase